MYVSSPLTRFVVAIALLAVIGVGAWRINAIGGGDQADTEVRVAIRPLADGRTEVAVQQRHGVRDADGWSERLTPDARFLPPDAEPGRWLVSSPVSLSGDDGETEPLKIALIQTVGGTGHERRNSFKLAIEHINAAGGVLGRPVIGVIADINFDRDFSVAVARRLVEEEGVHAFVGAQHEFRLARGDRERRRAPRRSHDQPVGHGPRAHPRARPRFLLPRRAIRTACRERSWRSSPKSAVTTTSA